MERYTLLKEKELDVVASAEIVSMRIADLMGKNEGDRYLVKVKGDSYRVHLIPRKNRDGSHYECFYVKATVTEKEDFLCSVKLEYLKDNFKYIMNYFVAAGVLGLGILGFFVLPSLAYKIASLCTGVLLAVLALFVWNEKEEVTSGLIDTVEKEVTSFVSDNSTKG
ncbi:MAG: hypothetical protein IKA51_02840 [Clostridia bacterium]|nr:hypothetical protein [Clostridia bacterium]